MTKLVRFNLAMYHMSMANNQKENNKGEIVIYKTKDGKASLKVKLREETVWLSQKQIAELFGTQRPAITKHLRNIFRSSELDEKSVCSILEHTAADSKACKTKFYNLDVIISVGYRVNSKRATQFRIWATKVLKTHLIKGYTINQKRLREKGFEEFEQAAALIKKTAETRQLTSGEAKGPLKVITDYAHSWLLLQKFDEQSLEIGKITRGKYQLNYSDANKAIMELKNILIIHGDNDKIVPIESNDKLPKKIKVVTVKGGDHDLQRPDMVKQYLNKVITFIEK